MLGSSRKILFVLLSLLYGIKVYSQDFIEDKYGFVWKIIPISTKEYSVMIGLWDYSLKDNPIKDWKGFTIDEYYFFKNVGIHKIDLNIKHNTLKTRLIRNNDNFSITISFSDPLDALKHYQMIIAKLDRNKKIFKERNEIGYGEVDLPRSGGGFTYITRINGQKSKIGVILFFDKLPTVKQLDDVFSHGLTMSIEMWVMDW